MSTDADEELTAQARALLPKLSSEMRAMLVALVGSLDGEIKISGWRQTPPALFRRGLATPDSFIGTHTAIITPLGRRVAELMGMPRQQHLNEPLEKLLAILGREYNTDEIERLRLAFPTRIYEVTCDDAHHMTSRIYLVTHEDGDRWKGVSVLCVSQCTPTITRMYLYGDNLEEFADALRSIFTLRAHRPEFSHAT